MARNGFCLKTKQNSFFYKGGGSQIAISGNCTGIWYVLKRLFKKGSQPLTHHITVIVTVTVSHTQSVTDIITVRLDCHSHIFIVITTVTSLSLCQFCTRRFHSVCTKVKCDCLFIPNKHKQKRPTNYLLKM